MLASQHNPLIKTIVLTEHGGKAVAVNAGVAKATADVILFVDIRPEIAPGAIQQLVSNFADPKVGCVAGELILRKKATMPPPRQSAGSIGATKSGSGHASQSSIPRSASMEASTRFAASLPCRSRPE